MVKQEVLAALDAVRGRYISGQELAAQLGVSRTAVWKAVAALRRDGIPIKAVTNRGYTLAQSVDVLNAAAVTVQLDETTVKALQSCGFDTIAAGDSFNDLAMIQASKAGFLFKSTDKIKADFPHIPAYEEFSDLLSAIRAAL